MREVGREGSERRPLELAAGAHHQAGEALHYQLPDLPHLRLRCTLEAQERVQLPAFKGSMLRGAFGRALRLSVCAFGPEQPCATCSLRRSCFYTRLFETFIEGEPPPFLSGLPTAPRPYVFESEIASRDLAPGGRLEFDLLLVGSAIELQALAAVAVARLAERGLTERRRRFRLLAVTSEEADGSFRQRWSAADPHWQGVAPGVAPSFAPLPAGGLTLRLLTPLRLKRDGQLQGELEFRELAFRMLRRVLELAYFFADRAAIDWHFRPLLDRARQVRITDRQLSWVDLNRYSSRQGTAMSLGGLVGILRLEGDLAPFTGLLRAAEVLHVGKAATFGLGRIRVEN